MKSVSLGRCLLILVVGFGLFSFSSAQEAGPDATAKKASFRLPNMFGKLGVDDEQRDKLIAIHQDYETKLKALRDQLKAAVKERDAAMEASLTDGQKLRLKELRQEAKKEAADKLSARKAKKSAAE